MEAFDLEQFEEEEDKYTALNCIAQTIDPQGVSHLLEALEEYGFSYEISQFSR